MKTRTLRALFLRTLSLTAPVAASSLTGCIFPSCPPANPYAVNAPLDGTQDDATADSGEASTGIDAGPDGSLDFTTCARYCPGSGPDGGTFRTCSLQTSAAGDQSIRCEYETLCVGGRRPAGFEDLGGPSWGSSVGAYLARQAALEEGSVDAFRGLARQLQAHGAPEPLRRSALRAAGDEARHARVVGRLAQRWGGAPRRTRSDAWRLRDLEGLARDNAVEGCVRETFAALLAEHQARFATDAGVRAVMASVARDETRHAALSWQLARWFDGRLSAEARARVAAARERAVETLEQELEGGFAGALVSAAGLPERERARQLLEALRGTLWSSAQAA